MSRTTVDFGIDLGTTNSAIGVLKGTEVEIIRNNEGFEYTPSAVFIDRNGGLSVGRRAKERLDIDADNAKSEFKLQMGTDAEYVFTRTGRRMGPDDLSAEVLKSLKADVKQRTGEDVQAAVITVPAAFELPQCKATNEAAKLAGISFSPLVQEPVAAAMAYGFQSESDRVFWLVYDLGGGTFDAAVIKMREGMIQVVNHGGDNQLGGKLIDWAIVEQLLVPAVIKEFNLSDFRRGNPKWSKAIAKLKLRAEEAKIRASHDSTVEILIDPLCQDESGENLTFEYELKKADVERVAEPFIAQSIRICRKVLADQKLAVNNVEKVLLVGGPSLTPYLRERLSDPKEGLGIPLDFSLDPLTVVARGAAIFAGSQRVVSSTPRTVAAGQFGVELDYNPVGPDPEPLVGGRVLSSGNGQDFTGFTLEFINTEARPEWRSGKVQLARSGNFTTTLWAERGRQNRFQINLCDATGSQRQISPDSLAYTVGTGMDNTMLIHTVGLALANNELQVFLEKGTQLPAKKRLALKLAERARKGQEEDAIRAPVVEGENKKADRNQLIGYLIVKGSDIKRDLPAGAEVEVTIKIDASRLVSTEAFVPLLDEEYKAELEMGKKVFTQEELAADVAEEKQRYEEMRDKVQATGDAKAMPILDRIQEEHAVEEMERALDAAGTDPDAADKCHKRLLGLKAAVDEIEETMKIPGLVAEGYQMIEWTEEVVTNYGKPADKNQFEVQRRELQVALEARVIDQDQLFRKIDRMDDLRMKVLTSLPDWWMGYLARLQDAKDRMTNQAAADQLIAQAMKAVNANDIEGVKAACRQLYQLLPSSDQKLQGEFKGNLARG